MADGTNIPLNTDLQELAQEWWRRLQAARQAGKVTPDKPVSADHVRSVFWNERKVKLSRWDVWNMANWLRDEKHALLCSNGSGYWAAHDVHEWDLFVAHMLDQIRSRAQTLKQARAVSRHHHALENDLFGQPPAHAHQKKNAA